MTSTGGMTHPNPSTALARVVVDELVVGGVRFIAVCPGSRSAALAIAASEHPQVETRVVIDERSAAFWALGVARASGRPAVVISTSGTAPANFFPAIVEADMSGVPLIVVSADRPLELRGVGANQTIDQMELFGAKVRAFGDIEAADPDVDGNVGWRDTVSDLVAAAMGRPMPGPVHLNVAFREPTVPVADDGRTKSQPYPFPTPRIVRNGEPAKTQGMLIDVAPDAGRGVVIAGDGEYDRAVVATHAGRLGWPILATALSGLRGADVVASYHFLLDRGVPDHLVPDIVVAIGAIGPDQVLERLFASARTRIRADLWGRHIDPGRNATHVLATDPVELLARIGGSTNENWVSGWLEADATTRSSVVAAMRSRSAMTGGAVAEALNQVGWGAMVVASSLPIREVDAHLTRTGPVFANRGASGIDGFVSTALGVASVIPRTLALAGDLSLLHDANGFLTDEDGDLTLVVVDNSGGGLFDSLPQARHAPDFERLFITPPHRDLVRLLEFHGVHCETVSEPAHLAPVIARAVDRPGLNAVVVPVDRDYDLRMRGESYS